MAGERVPKQPAPTSAPTTSLNVSQFCGRKPRAEPSLMPGRAGERVRVLRGAAVLQGWDPANFLVAEAQTALCVIYVEDDDWDWCCAFRQRQVGHVLFSQLEGSGRVHLGRARRSSPAEPRLGGRGGSLRRAAKVRRGSDVVEQNQWNAMLELCFHDVVAPKFILAAGPRCVEKGSFACDVLNGPRGQQVVRVFG